MEMSIKEAAEQLKVEPHVLRYWEDELRQIGRAHV